MNQFISNFADYCDAHKLRGFIIITLSFAALCLLSACSSTEDQAYALCHEVHVGQYGDKTIDQALAEWADTPTPYTVRCQELITAYHLSRDKTLTSAARHRAATIRGEIAKTLMEEHAALSMEVVDILLTDIRDGNE
jgi:hypothetical protein